ncbi:ATP-dependent exoDNAse (exonuclease V) alpha subunit [Bradyrhizobium yuanmingense]|uniref:MobQ family relaxase n=1 Tax=Bradyrhizobium yuanmingense TaxID=108015 RepID=UPI003517588E
MASYHLTAQPVKRSEGRSVVAMAAYRAGQRLKDERRGVDADYRRRRGVAHTEIMAPEGTAHWLRDRETLWNYVERMEVRKDAQLAREINLALPHELTDAQRLALLRKFVREEFVSQGMVADFAIHKPVPEKGDDPRNYHAHILLTLRQAEWDGLRRVKTREWNSDQMLVKWRAAWADRQNEFLRVHGHKATVDHRSLAVQRAAAVERGERVQALLLDRSAEIHVGPKAKKAGLAGPPKSKDREAGPPRMCGKHSARRQVRYTKIDKGSRGQANINRLAENAEKLQRHMSRAERSVARFRRRMRVFEQELWRLEQDKREKKRSAWEKIRSRSKGNVADLFISRESRIKHLKKRKQQCAWWVDQLDQILRALLGIREHQLTRKTVWGNRMKRWRPNNFAPSRLSGRRRFRTLPGS